MADELLHALGMRQAEESRRLEGEPSTDESDEVRALLRPFEDEERANLLDGVFEQLERETAAAPGDEAPRDAAPQVVALEPRRRSRLAWIGVVTAIAAALLLWLGSRGRITPSETLPPYEATRLEGGVAAMRSSDADPPSSISLHDDASIDWIFTPRAPVRTPVGAVLLATSAEQRTVLVRPEALEVSEEGVVRLAGRRAEVLPLSPGTWSVTVLLGAPATLPRTAGEAEHAGGWSRVSFEVTIAAAP